MYTATHIIDQSIDVIGFTMYLVLRCMVILGELQGDGDVLFGD